MIRGMENKEVLFHGFDGYYYLDDNVISKGCCRIESIFTQPPRELFLRKSIIILLKKVTLNSLGEISFLKYTLNSSAPSDLK